MLRKTLLSLILSATTALTFANERTDSVVEAFMQKHDIPGVAITVCRNEQVIFSKGYGTIDGTAPATDSTLFRVASLSKQFTAVAVMKLVEQQRLSLDSKVLGKGGILEEEFGTDVPQQATEVTVRNLLQHNSGWSSEVDDPMFPELPDSPYEGKNLHDRIAYMLAHDPQTYPTASHYAYCNIGYGMLGMVIEKVSGMEYEAFLKRYVLEPAGIKDIHVGGDKSGRCANETVYYSQDGTDGYLNDMQMIKAAGGLIASSREMARFMCSLDYGTTVPDVLTPGQLDQLYTPAPCYDGYGLGCCLNPATLKDWASYHTGGLSGTATVWSRGKDGVVGVLLCNSYSNREGFGQELCEALHEVEKTLDVE